MFSFFKNKIAREIMGLLLIAFAVFAFISLISYHSDDPSFNKYINEKVAVKNYAGIVGAYFSDAIIQFLGSCSLFIVRASFFLGWTLLWNERLGISISSLIGGVSGTIFLCSFVYLLFSRDPLFGKIARPGGAIGYFVAEELIWFFNRGGAYIIIFTFLILSIILTTRISIGNTLIRVNGFLGYFINTVSPLLRFKSARKKERKVKQPPKKAENNEPPQIISAETDEGPEEFEISEQFEFIKKSGEYSLQPLSLLDPTSPEEKKRSEDEFITNSDILEKKLRDVGIEIPNLYRESVSLREILSSEEFKKAKSKLSMGLGKDTSGSPVVTDLAQIPHLLIAGATGSGKSVGVNRII